MLTANLPGQSADLNDTDKADGDSRLTPLDASHGVRVDAAAGQSSWGESARRAIGNGYRSVRRNPNS